MHSITFYITKVIGYNKLSDFTSKGGVSDNMLVCFHIVGFQPNVWILGVGIAFSNLKRLVHTDMKSVLLGLCVCLNVNRLKKE